MWPSHILRCLWCEISAEGAEHAKNGVCADCYKKCDNELDKKFYREAYREAAAWKDQKLFIRNLCVEFGRSTFASILSRHIGAPVPESYIDGLFNWSTGKAAGNPYEESMSLFQYLYWYSDEEWEIERALFWREVQGDVNVKQAAMLVDIAPEERTDPTIYF